MHCGSLKTHARLGLSLSIKKVLGALLLLGIGLLPATAYANRSDATVALASQQLMRQFTLRNTVNLVHEGLQLSLVQSNGVMRPPAMAAGGNGFPNDMGRVPAGLGVPQRDGAGRPLGYCAWDLSSAVSGGGYLAGQGLAQPLVYAVVSGGINGVIETSCAQVAGSLQAVGDDYIQYRSPVPLMNQQFRTVATQGALGGETGTEGEIRLVLEDNTLYSYIAGSWQNVSNPGGAGSFADDSASNGQGAISYTEGKVTVGEFEAATAAINSATINSGTITNATITSLTVSGASTLSGGLSVTGNTSITGNLSVTGAVSSTVGFSGDGAQLTDLNAANITSGILAVAQGGTGVGAIPQAGQLLIGNGTGYTLGGITGTVNQINVVNGAGSIALSLPQDIATTSTPTFGGMVLNGQLTAATAYFSGNVGIGVMNPSNALDVAGSVRASGLLTAAGGMQVNTGQELRFGDLTEQSDPVFISRVNPVFDQSLLRIAIGDNASGFGNGDSDELQIGRSNGDRTEFTPVFRIAGNGDTLSTGNITANSFIGNGSGLTDLDASQFTTGILPVARGGTGVDASAAANGRLLIGNGSGFTLANITGTANQINVVNGAGSITLSLPQDIAPTSTPTFGGLSLNGQLIGTDAIFTGAVVAQRLVVSSSEGGVGEVNTIIGLNAMTGAQAGRGGNTATGFRALESNTIGEYNTAHGGLALQSNIGGDYNSAFGSWALRRNTTGDSNTAMGEDALLNNTSGSANTGIGRDALAGNLTGSNNSALGFAADVVSANLSFATAIGASSLVSSSNTLVLGRESTDQVVIGATARSDSHANTRLYVYGAVNIADKLFVNGVEHLPLNKTNIDMELTYASDTTDPAFNQPSMALGAGALSSAKRAANVAFGPGVMGTLAADPNGLLGSDNTGLGYRALFSATTGYRNTALGTRAAHNLTSGYANTAVGRGAGYGIASGYENTVLGENALFNGATAYQNIVIGKSAMFNATGAYGNIAVGNNNLLNATTAYENTSMGRSALQGTTTGFRNIGLGMEALQTNTTGRYNLGLGYRADVTSGDLIYAAAIGNMARVSTSNTLVLGGLGVNKFGSAIDDQVVIGATARDDTFSNTKLFVQGVTNLNGDLRGTTATFTGEVIVANNLRVRTNSLLSFQSVDGTGSPLFMQRNDDSPNGASLRLSMGNFNVGFGSADTSRFQIGNRESGVFAARFEVAANGQVKSDSTMSAVSFNSTSDRRLKTNIQAVDLDSIAIRLSAIQPHTYNYINAPEAGRRLGVIAQELLPILPEAVFMGADGFYSVDYGAIGVLAAAGVGRLNVLHQELAGKVDVHNTRLDEIDTLLATTTTRVDELEAWRSTATERLDSLQAAVDLNIEKIAANALAIAENTTRIETLEEVLGSLETQVGEHTQAIQTHSQRWASHFESTEGGDTLTVKLPKLVASNFTAQQIQAKDFYTERLEAEMARIAELEVNNLRANTATARSLQGEVVNTGSANVYASVGAPAFLFAAAADGHYTVNTSALDGSYATATVIVNAGQAQIVPIASEGLELFAQGNSVKVNAAGKTIRASWIKTG